MTDTAPTQPDAKDPSGAVAAADTAKAAPDAVPAAKPSPVLTPEYRSHIEALINGREKPVAGTEELVGDLKEIAAQQAQTRQSLEQAAQLVQSKQAEFAQLEGAVTALMRVLHRAEERSKQKT